MLTVGLGEPPASITGIKALAARALRAGDRPGSVTPPEPDWIERQLRRRGIDDERVLAAMARVPRELFVPEELRPVAYDGQPAAPAARPDRLPAVHGRADLPVPRLRPGERVLDVGTGSGYAAAVLAELAAEVHSIERIPELAESARAALAAAGYERVAVHVGDGSLGLPEHAPYGGIAVAAAAIAVPPALWGSSRSAAGSSCRSGRPPRSAASASWSARRTGRTWSRPCPRGSSRS